jgi:hypothetical protein
MNNETLVDTLSKGFITLETGGGKHSIKLEFQTSDDVWEAYMTLIKSLYPENREE